MKTSAIKGLIQDIKISRSKKFNDTTGALLFGILIGVIMIVIIISSFETI